MKLKIAVFLLGTALAAPAFTQTSNDDTVATEAWWDKVGAGFFSDASLETPRPEYEIRAHFTGLSADDQAALRARCAEMDGQGAGMAPSTQEGQVEPVTPEGAQTGAEQAGDSQSPVTSDPSTTVTGTQSGAEVQDPSATGTPEPYTGLAGATNEPDGRMVRICDLVRTL